MKSLLIVILLAVPMPGFANHELKKRDLTNGSAMYAEHCSSCHGIHLEGQTDWHIPDDDGIRPAPPHDETGHTWHHDSKLLFDYTKLGGQSLFERLGVTDVKSGMPGFANLLDDDDIWDILAFIRSSWPEEIKQIQDGLNPIHR